MSEEQKPTEEKIVTAPDLSKMKGPFIIQRQVVRKKDNKILEWTAQNMTPAMLSKMTLLGCNGQTMYKFKKHFVPVILETQDQEIIFKLERKQNPNEGN